MKAIKIVCFVVVAIILVPLLAAVFIPRTYHIERKKIIRAEPKVVFNKVNDFQEWTAWSPWKFEDTSNIYTGPKAGVGCKVTWMGRGSESGSAEIIESTPNSSIATALVFSKSSRALMHFTFTPVTEGTTVIWADDGSESYPQNIFNLFADKMMGKDFESGLNNLKRISESE